MTILNTRNKQTLFFLFKYTLFSYISPQMIQNPRTARSSLPFRVFDVIMLECEKSSSYAYLG